MNRSLLLLLTLGSSLVSLFLSTVAMAGLPSGANVLTCHVQDEEARTLVLVFNESPVEKATLAVMLGVTEKPAQYHPAYGATSLHWKNGALSVVFENTLAIDWEHEPLTDDCYVYRGGYYTFEHLKRTAQGKWEGIFRLPKKLVRHPDRNCVVPDEVFTPPTKILCE